jgi:dUTP pyrophosphatase
MTANFIKLHPAANIPVRGSKYSAGYDLSACIDEPIMIRPHTTVKIGTGLVIQPPKGYFGAIFARSGMATKRGLRPANCVGVCDEDYRGEYIVALHNDSDEHQFVQPGERIAQLVFLPYNDITFIEQTSLSETDRGSDGFGSTGTK